MWINLEQFTDGLTLREAGEALNLTGDGVRKKVEVLSPNKRSLVYLEDGVPTWRCDIRYTKIGGDMDTPPE